VLVPFRKYFVHSKLDRAILNLFGFIPKNRKLFEQAFRHKSVAVEIKNGVKNSNERLEFLGDAVLGSIVAHYLFKRYPYKNEGFLTEMRSRIVSRTYLNQLAIKMGLDQFIQYDLSNRIYKSIMGDTFEAIIGAIYLDRGFEFTQKIVLERIIQVHIDLDELELKDLNFKSRIINWSQKERKNLVFKCSEEQDKAKNILYKVTVEVEGQNMGMGLGNSKKMAEQQAAENACKLIFSESEPA
jgi:ribonuclease-3